MEALKRKFLCNTSGSSLVCLKTSHMNVNKNGSISFVGAENSTELSVYKPGIHPTYTIFLESLEAFYG